MEDTDDKEYNGDKIVFVRITILIKTHAHKHTAHVECIFACITQPSMTGIFRLYDVSALMKHSDLLDFHTCAHYTQKQSAHFYQCKSVLPYATFKNTNPQQRPERKSGL